MSTRDAPPPPRIRSSLTVLCVTFAAFGAPVGMLGAGWPGVHHSFGTSLGSLGLVAAAWGLGKLATATSALPILRRWHVRPALVVLASVLALSVLGAAVTRSYPVLVACFALIGLSSGVLDALGTRYQTVIRDVSHAGLMYGSYGVGATLGPLLVALSGWTTAFVAAAGVCALAAVLAADRSLWWPEAMEGNEPHRRHAEPLELHLGALLVSLSLFAIYCSLEVTTASWAASYFVDARHASDRSAALAMSGFWLGMTLGRLGLGRLAGAGRRLSPQGLLVASACLATVTYLLLLVAPVPAGLVLPTVAGLSLAGMFPTLMSTTADRVGVAATGRVTGWQLVSANVAELCVAALVGAGVNRAGAGVPAQVLAVMAVLGLPLVLRAARLHADGGPHGAPGDGEVLAKQP